MEAVAVRSCRSRMRPLSLSPPPSLSLLPDMVSELSSGGSPFNSLLLPPPPPQEEGEMEPEALSLRYANKKVPPHASTYFTLLLGTIRSTAKKKYLAAWSDFSPHDGGE